MLKQRKQIKVSLYKLLKIIELLEDVKHLEIADELLEIVAAAISNELLDSEIEEYSSWYLSEAAEDQGYDKEHYDSAISILENFKKNYCNKLRGN